MVCRLLDILYSLCSPFVVGGEVYLHIETWAYSTVLNHHLRSIRSTQPILRVRCH